MELKEFERKTAAKLLEVASEYFSRRGCDELNLDFLTPEERETLLWEYEQWNLSPEDFDPEQTEFSHWALMAYLADRLAPELMNPDSAMPRMLRRNTDEMGQAINSLVDWQNGHKAMDFHEVAETINTIVKFWSRFSTNATRHL